MTYNVYSIRDVKTNFGNPFIDSSDESAIRGFGLAFSSSSPLVAYAPSDFELYRIGKFDSLSGHLTDELPTFICSASSFVKVGDSIEK